MSTDVAPVRQTQNHALLVNPHERQDGFWANIRGNPFDLADPDSGHSLAPTPDELFILSIASALAWAAREFLRRYELPDGVSISATWQAEDGVRNFGDISMKVTVSSRAEASGRLLLAALQDALGTSSPSAAVHLSFEGATRRNR